MTETTDTGQNQERLQQERAILSALPELPCPNCGANVLEYHGFYNYCDETSSLREKNYLIAQSGSIYLEHDEDGYETDGHECRMEVYCAGCEQELPWSVPDIRQLDGESPEKATEIITRLIQESQEEDEPAVESAPPVTATQEQETKKEVHTA